MQIRFVGTQQDFIDGQRTHWWRRYSPRSAKLQRLLTPYLGLALIALAYFLTYRVDRSLGGALFSGACGLYLVLAPTVISPLLLRRAYRRRKSRDPQEVILNFNDDSIELNCPGFSHSVLEWSAIKGFIEDHKTVLIYVSAANFLMIPKRVLSDEQDKALLTLLEHKGIRRGCPKPAS